jgi:transposase
MSGDDFTRRYTVVAEARRRWGEAEKRAIVAEAERPEANISAVARRHGIKPSLLFRWRRMARELASAEPVFMPVALASPSAYAAAPIPYATPAAPASLSDKAPAQCSLDSRIEIELKNGRLVRFGAGVDTDALKRVLDLLDRR